MQLNKPLRPCGVEQLLAEKMQYIGKDFEDVNAVVISAYKKRRREMRVIDEGGDKEEGVRIIKCPIYLKYE